MRLSRILNPKALIISMLGVVSLIVVLMTVGINDSGYRTFVQWPNGHTFVKFEPGWYIAGFGTTEVYPDVITFDYDKNDDQESSINQLGISVRYQDGGLGTIYGKDRFALPNDELTMMQLHKAFRSAEGVGTKLIKPVTEEATNLTAGLLTSEGAYAEQRGTFIQWSQQQIGNGKFKQRLESKLVKGEDGKEVWKKVPVIAMDEANQPIVLSSDLGAYGIVLMGHQITDWNFEKKTLDQISTKRQATMAIITAKANAERAKQDAITAEEQGKANVMKAKYEQEVLKEKAIVVAEREKQVATIKAVQLVDVAFQQKLEAEQKKLAANEYKQEQILRGEGDGEYKRLVMEADGALQQKLTTYERVSKLYASAIAQQKWVPEIALGGSGTNGSAANDLVSLLTTKAAKDLSLDMQIKK
ncbi:MAG: hypothetical protein GY707_05665 [Desulfobacteraceae bacterium]|nr:hypothetical protein [Desulfobacteraceae bacterium]